MAFFLSHDKKFIMKEVKSADMRFFREGFFQPYFDYLSKSFFHDFPCAIAKILGAFQVTIQNNTTGKTKKLYFVVSENMNFL